MVYTACVMVAMVMKSDDVMTTAAVPADGDSQPVQDAEAAKPGLFDVIFYTSMQFQYSGVRGIANNLLGGQERG